MEWNEKRKLQRITIDFALHKTVSASTLVEQIKIRIALRLPSFVLIVILQTAVESLAAEANYREWQQHLPLI